MRIVFMGTPEFAVPSLRALAARGDSLSLVLSQPDRPRGRGHKLQPTPVHAAAQELGLDCWQPQTLRGAEPVERLGALSPDLIVVAAYGLLLPPKVLALPRFGCINVHASLLPAYRGAAPIHRAILAGESQTGVTIMRMEKGLDTGPMLLSEVTPIGAEENAGELTERLSLLGARLLCEALARMERGELPEFSQPAEGVSWASLIEKSEGELDFSRPASLLARQIRGLTPKPGAFTFVAGGMLKILAAEPVESAANAAPGALLSDKRPLVATGEGALLLRRVQPAGKGEMSGEAWLAGRRLAAGFILGGKQEENV